MDKIDSAGSVAGVIALPYTDGAVEQWIKSWSPLIDGAPQAFVKALIDDPVVEQAMEGLTHGINLAHAVLNVRDKEHTIRTLRILRRKNTDLIPKPSGRGQWPMDGSLPQLTSSAHWRPRRSN
ncbi:hypothetical protein LLY42_21000 [Pseudomonas frederiksbergensis]|nr:hypothetical protein LLY42_21000 [Pseudomonas frederiksbergensis]